MDPCKLINKNNNRTSHVTHSFAVDLVVLMLSDSGLMNSSPDTIHITRQNSQIKNDLQLH